MQKIAIAAGCVYSVYKIFKFKFMEASEISMETGLEKEQNRHRFLTIQNDAHLTMKQIIPLLSNFYKHFDIVDSITLQLKSLPKGSSLSNKENLWETLKIHAIVKFLSKRYTELSLFFLCNLQMCILANQIHDINQKEYFAFSWYLLEIGTLKIEEKVRKIVNEYVYNISLKERFSKMSFLHLIETLHSEIGASFLLSCLFPTVDELGAVSSKCLKEQMSPEIMKLVQETIDVIQQYNALIKVQIRLKSSTHFLMPCLTIY